MSFFSYPDKGPIQSKNRHVPYRPRYRWGVSIGLGAATVVSLFAALTAAVQGRLYFERYGLNLWQIVGSYFLAGTVCGIALAFLYPLASHRWGAVLLGFVLGTIAYGTMGVAMIGWEPFTVVIALIPGLLVGGGIGLVEHDRSHPRVE